MEGDEGGGLLDATPEASLVGLKAVDRSPVRRQPRTLASFSAGPREHGSVGVGH